MSKDGYWNTFEVTVTDLDTMKQKKFQTKVFKGFILIYLELDKSELNTYDNITYGDNGLKMAVNKFLNIRLVCIELSYLYQIGLANAQYTADIVNHYLPRFCKNRSKLPAILHAKDV